MKTHWIDLEIKVTFVYPIMYFPVFEMIFEEVDDFQNNEEAIGFFYELRIRFSSLWSGYSPVFEMIFKDSGDIQLSDEVFFH